MQLCPPVAAARLAALRRPRGYGPLAGLAGDGQVRALQAMAAACPESAPELLARAEAIVARLEALGPRARVRLLAQRVLDRCALLARLIMAAVFPAPSLYGGRTDLAAREIATLAAQHGVERVCLMTDDHIALDGLLISGAWQRGSAQVTAAQPILVLAGGNGMAAESLLREARTLATHHGMRVLVYNSRGVGRSAGRACRTQHLVADAGAALRFARARGPALGTFGVSLGGGILTAALAAAQAAGELTPEDVRVHVVCHSFASLPACVGGLVDGGAPRGARGAWLRAVGWLARTVTSVLFHVAGLDPLNSVRTLRAGPVAARTLVLAAGADDLMRGNGCLARALAAGTGGKAHGVQCLRTRAQGHMDLRTYFASPALLGELGRCIRDAWVKPLICSVSWGGATATPG